MSKARLEIDLTGDKPIIRRRKIQKRDEDEDEEWAPDEKSSSSVSDAEAMEDDDDDDLQDYLGAAEEAEDEEQEIDPDDEDDQQDLHYIIAANLDQEETIILDPIEELEEPVQVVGRAGGRRSNRLAATGIKAAFQTWQQNGLQAFLQTAVISGLFEPAFEAFQKFGQGLSAAFVERIWTCYWDRTLRVRSMARVYNNLNAMYARDMGNDELRDSFEGFVEEINSSHCGFCNLRRNLTICIFDITGPTYEGLIGADCWNIRFKPLMALVDTCYRLRPYLNHPNFDLVARRYIEACMKEIQEAPAKMAAAYAHLN